MAATWDGGSIGTAHSSDIGMAHSGDIGMAHGNATPAAISTAAAMVQQWHWPGSGGIGTVNEKKNVLRIGFER